MKLRLPKTIWIAWCSTCPISSAANIAAESSHASASSALLVKCNPHDVEVIPYRLDRRAARKVKARKA